MDEMFFYIVVFVIWILFQVLGGKKKKKKRPVTGTTAQPLPGATPRPAAAPGAEPTLEDALREIRQALGMEVPTQAAPPPRQAAPPPLPSPRPEPRPKPRPKAKPRPVRHHGPELAETAPKKSWSSEFKAHETHFADSDFEEFTGEGDRFGKPRLQKTPPHPAAQKPPVQQPSVEFKQPESKSVSRSTVMKQLNDPKAAREAFILSEILGSPRAHRRF